MCQLFIEFYEMGTPGKVKGGDIYVQMPQAQAWASYISTLVLLLPDHRDLKSEVFNCSGNKGIGLGVSHEGWYYQNINAPIFTLFDWA